VPPRLTLSTASDMVRRLPWAVSMLRTRHKTFGNLSGYSAAGTDMSNLASWIGSQVLASNQTSTATLPILMLCPPPSPLPFSPLLSSTTS
jgi:hypothetical protein